MGCSKNIIYTVLAACLTSGCVHCPSRSDGRASLKLVSLAEAVEPISGDAIVLGTREVRDGGLEPFDLLWAETLFPRRQWDRDPVFVTCHASRVGAG